MKMTRGLDDKSKQDQIYLSTKSISIQHKLSLARGAKLNELVLPHSITYLSKILNACLHHSHIGLF